MILNPDGRLLALCDELNSMINEIGSPAISNQFNLPIQQLRQELTNPELKVDVLCVNEPEGTFREKISSFLLRGYEELFPWGKPGNTVSIRLPNMQMGLTLKPMEKVFSNSLGTVHGIINIVVVSREDSKDEDLFNKLQVMVADKAAAIFVFEDICKLANHQKAELTQQMTYSEWIEGEIIAEKDFVQMISQPDYALIIGQLMVQTVTNTFETVNSFLTIMLEQEERGIKAKKIVNQQQLMKVQSKSPDNLNDILTQIRNQLTNQLNMFDKGCTEMTENLLRPQTGAFSRKLDEHINTLVGLEEKPQMKTISLEVPAAFEKKYFEDIYNIFFNHGMDQLISLRDTFRGVSEELNSFCAKAGLPHLPLDFKFLTDDSLRLILDSSLRTERTYSGTMPKKGFYEYFMAMRKYQMILFMMISTFGLTFVRDMKNYMIPATILLLGYGGFSVYKSVKEESKEIEEKELAKAKDHFRNEGKRIASEIGRQWQKVLSDHIRAQLANNQANLEQFLKEYTTSRMQESEEEKKKLQRQIQSVELTERKLSNMTRTRETFIRNLQRLKMDSRQQLISLLRKVKFA